MGRLSLEGQSQSLDSDSPCRSVRAFTTVTLQKAPVLEFSHLSPPPHLQPRVSFLRTVSLSFLFLYLPKLFCALPPGGPLVVFPLPRGKERN